MPHKINRTQYDQLLELVPPRSIGLRETVGRLFVGDGTAHELEELVLFCIKRGHNALAIAGALIAAEIDRKLAILDAE